MSRRNGGYARRWKVWDSRLGEPLKAVLGHRPLGFSRIKGEASGTWSSVVVGGSIRWDIVSSLPYLPWVLCNIHHQMASDMIIIIITRSVVGVVGVVGIIVIVGIVGIGIVGGRQIQHGVGRQTIAPH